MAGSSGARQQRLHELVADERLARPRRLVGVGQVDTRATAGRSRSTLVGAASAAAQVVELLPASSLSCAAEFAHSSRPGRAGAGRSSRRASAVPARSRRLGRRRRRCRALPALLLEQAARRGRIGHQVDALHLEDRLDHRVVSPARAVRASTLCERPTFSGACSASHSKLLGQRVLGIEVQVAEQPLVRRDGARRGSTPRRS